MKKLIVYLTIFSLLFTSCATISKVKPGSNVELFDEIQVNSKDKRTTVELINGKFYHTQNLKFEDDFLTFIEKDSSKVERIELSEIHRVVIDLKEVSTTKGFLLWELTGVVIGGILSLMVGAPNADSESSLFTSSQLYAASMIVGLTIGTIGGIVYVMKEKYKNRIIYNFSPKPIK